jgi:hypothetical protein
MGIFTVTVEENGNEIEQYTFVFPDSSLAIQFHQDTIKEVKEKVSDKCEYVVYSDVYNKQIQKVERNYLKKVKL